MSVRIPGTEWYGTVMVRNYLKVPWTPGPVAGVTGNCKVTQNEEILGFKTGARDANWSVIIQGEKVTVVVPGCEVINMISRDDPGIDFSLNPEIIELP